MNFIFLSSLLLLFICLSGPAYIFGFSHCLHSNSHNQKVQMHMMDLMSSIIMEGDGVTQELLDTILINLIPAHKVGFSCFFFICFLFVSFS